MYTFIYIHTLTPTYKHTLASLLSMLNNSPKTNDRTEPHVLTHLIYNLQQPELLFIKNMQRGKTLPVSHENNLSFVHYF